MASASGYLCDRPSRRQLAVSVLPSALHAIGIVTLSAESCRSSKFTVCAYVRNRCVAVAHRGLEELADRWQLLRRICV